MSGRLGNYWELIKAAEQARIAITKAQQKQIADLYQEIADDLNHRLQRYNPESLTYRWVKDYAKSLQKDSKRLYTTIKTGVADSLLQSAKAPVRAEQAFYSKLAPELSEHFSDVFSRVPQSAADELMSGGIYKDFSGLSDRIWNYRKKYNRDIQTVIVKGIDAQKSAFDLAKDLEMYVDPKAAKPWNWNIVYPGVNQVVDYNAQRLARTAVTHAYQLSFQRATKDNPFVESYKWHSSHGARMCELCAQRDGRIYRKDALPFDHPNGMCTVTAVIPKSYDEISKELGDWAAGKNDNPALNKWLLKSDNKDLQIANKESINPLEKLQQLKYNKLKNQERLSPVDQKILNSKGFEEIQDLKGTLENPEVRLWYKAQDKKIPSLVDKSQPLKQQAQQACELRNTFRTQARDLMKDQETRRQLDMKYPNLPFEYYVNKYSKPDASGNVPSSDDIYKLIVEKSTTSNKVFDKKVGVKDEN